MFKEFEEFTNPEEKDYDITSSLKSEEENVAANFYSEQLFDLVGILEDGEWENYGLSDEEYFNPTEETVNKVREQVKTR